MQGAVKYLIIIGGILILLGLVLWLAGDKLNWPGRMPGDIRVERENFRFYFPVTTMILLSLLVSFLLWLFRKFF